MRLLRALLVTALPLLGCGGAIQGSNDGGPTDDAPAPVPDAGPVGCPQAAPSQGATCGTAGLTCDYGTNARWTCNTSATCSGGGWSVTEPASDCPTPACAPGSVQDNQPCAKDPLTCDDSSSSATSFCSCVSGGPVILDGGGEGWWMCTSVQPPCPAIIPALGTACSQPGLQCDYGVCAGPSGLAVQCSNGTWAESEETEPCPL